MPLALGNRPAVAVPRSAREEEESEESGVREGDGRRERELTMWNFLCGL